MSPASQIDVFFCVYEENDVTTIFRNKYLETETISSMQGDQYCVSDFILDLPPNISSSLNYFFKPCYPL